MPYLETEDRAVLEQRVSSVLSSGTDPMPISLDKSDAYSGNEIENRAKTSLAPRVKG